MTAVRVAEAQAAILATVNRQPTLRLPLGDALGHRLAEDVLAPWPLPMWNAASMDGYAVRGSDVRGARSDAPMLLPISGGADAGENAPPPLAPGTAWRVATGGRVPVNADSVVRQEDVTVGPPLAAGDVGNLRTGAQHDIPETILVTSDRDAGRNVRPAGGDVAQGAVVLQAGTSVTPAVVAMLAALGEASPMVYRKPRVAILCSGNEVASLDQVEQIASGSRIADVNGPMLHALVREAGGVPVPLGLVPDDREAIATAVRAATDADLVISAGGISVGVMDHIVAVMEMLQARIAIRRVTLRPGGPTTHAVLPDGRPWLALPGNPVSAFVTFHLFAAPAIRRMAGEEQAANSERRTVTVRMRETVAREPVLDLYLRVTLEPANDGGPPWARLTGNQGSWVLSSIVRADALIIVPAGSGSVSVGDAVSGILLRA